MSEVFAELFGRFFLRLTNATGIDDYIVIVRDTVNPNGSEGEVLECIVGLRANCPGEDCSSHAELSQEALMQRQPWQRW
jgi:hypothetical protein